MPAARRGDLLVALSAFVPLALFVARERAIAGAAGFPLDDAWIHLHFARNLIEGAGFSYNPGQPVAGSTAPLWTLMVAGAALVVGASIMTAKALGVAATIAAGIVTRRAALAWGATPAAATAGGVALVWTGAMAWGALSGMEVSVAALLVAAALLAHARGSATGAAVAAALAALARPEAIVLVPLLAVAGRLTLRRLALFTAVTALVLGPAVLFSLATVGSPVPATAAAKIEGGLIGFLSGVRESPAETWLRRPWQFLVAWFGWLATTHWLLPLAVMPGIAIAWWRGGPRLAIPGLALLAHPLAMALLAPYRDPSFQEGRYSMHLLPLALVILAIAVPRGPRWARATLIVWLAIAVVRWPGAADRYAWAVQNINGMQVSLGHWVDRNLPRTARIAVNDIGAIVYVSRRDVIDLMGLVTPEIIPYRRRGEAGVIDYVRETCPDFVIVFPTWFPELTKRAWMLQPIHRVRLERNVVSGSDEMVVYRLLRCAV
ncbi:MAG: hypothetical protein HYU41_06135 [Candidatus Rokubacteria bacterium]|nr:hypothetical protein [Candidatus Rokubacteria bacterium]